MHVLVIPSWYPRYTGDASGSFFREQAIALANLGINVGLLYPNQRSLRDVFKPQTLPRGINFNIDEGVRVVLRHGYNLTPRLEQGIAAQWVSIGRALFKAYVARHGTPDVIHAHCAVYAGMLAQRLALESGIPYVVTEHSTAYFQGLVSKRQLRWARQVYENSKINIAVSASLQRFLVENLCFPGRWDVVPNIVDSSFFKTRISSSREDQGIRLLHAALLNPIKRQDLLIEAVARCNAALARPVTLSIAGDGPERARLEASIRAHGLAGKVTLLGMVGREQMPALMAAHDAFVLTSDYETFGVVVAEALASGLHAIVTDCGGPTDIIGPDDGSIVDRGDAQAIATAIIAWSTVSLGSESRQARRERCAARFSAPAVAARLVQAYAEVLAH
jgi:glycosyltransferase involved in cell wall biosynthesis